MIPKSELNITIKKSMLRLATEYPFFSYLFNYCHMKKDVECPTIGVDKWGTIVYNEEFLCSLTPSEIRGVLIHEIMHLVYDHLNDLYLGNNYNQMLMNVAMDIKVNSTVKELSKLSSINIELPKGGIIPDTYNDIIDIPPLNVTLYKLSKKSSINLYDELNKRLKQNKEQGSDMDSIEDGLKSSNFDQHIKSSNSDKSTNPNISNEKVKSSAELSDFWQDKILEAGETQKMSGDMPGFLSEIIHAIETPQMDWRDILREFIKAYDVTYYSYSRKHKKSAALDMYLPHQVKEGVSVKIYMDVSGSVSKAELGQFLSEINGIFNEFQSADVNITTFDTQLNDSIELTEDTDKLNVTGRGGTDFSKVFDDENVDDNDLIIIMSDGEDSYPSNRDNYYGEVLWCITSKNIEHLKELNGGVITLEIKK